MSDTQAHDHIETQEMLGNKHLSGLERKVICFGSKLAVFSMLNLCTLSSFWKTVFCVKKMGRVWETLCDFCSLRWVPCLESTNYPGDICCTVPVNLLFLCWVQKPYFHHNILDIPLRKRKCLLMKEYNNIQHDISLCSNTGSTI